MTEIKYLTPQAKNRLPEVDEPDVIRFCPKCGREIPVDRQYCVSCGNTGAIPRPVQSRKQKFLMICAVTAVMFLLLLGMVFFTRGETASAPTLLPTASPIARGTSVPVILLDDGE